MPNPTNATELFLALITANPPKYIIVFIRERLVCTYWKHDNDEETIVNRLPETKALTDELRSLAQKCNIFHEGDRVQLKANRPKMGLKKGDSGIIAAGVNGYIGVLFDRYPLVLHTLLAGNSARPIFDFIERTDHA